MKALYLNLNFNYSETQKQLQANTTGVDIQHEPLFINELYATVLHEDRDLDFKNVPHKVDLFENPTNIDAAIL